MTLVVAAETPPLTADSAGVLRIGETRLTLDTVVGAFRDGATAEEIAAQYPVLSLRQVYAVIACYLAHPNDVDAYLRVRAPRSQEVRQGNERIFEPSGVRARLLARQAGPDSA